MAYKGIVAQLPLGQGGLLTDDSPNLIPAVNLIKSRNVRVNAGILQNEPGSLAWNKIPISKKAPTANFKWKDGSIYAQNSVLPAVLSDIGYGLDSGLDGVVAGYDWFPEPGVQFLIIVTRGGRVYRFSDFYTSIEIKPDPSMMSTQMINGLVEQVVPTGQTIAPTTLNIVDRVHIMECGQEEVGAPRKLFIFTGGSQVQVITGISTVRNNIAAPAADWTIGNYPTFGIVYLNRVFAFGNPNNPHHAYASDNQYTSPFVPQPIPPLDPTYPIVTTFGNEDFINNPFNTAFFNIFPGDGQKLSTMFNYKGRLFAVKYPRGLYGIVTQNVTDVLGWYFTKINEDFGTASVHASCPVFDDYWIATAENSIVSLSAEFSLGSVSSANILKENKVSKYFNDIISPLGAGARQALWDPQGKKAFFLTRKTSFDCVIQTGSSSSVNSMMIVFDLSSNTMKIGTSDKDQPNCIFTRRNSVGKDEVFIGSEDGYIYIIGCDDRSIKMDPPAGQMNISVSGVTGNIPTGTYAYGVSFVNTNKTVTTGTGTSFQETTIGSITQEIIPLTGSPWAGVTAQVYVVPNITTSTGNGQVYLQSIPTSTNPFVTSRNIFRASITGVAPSGVPSGTNLIIPTGNIGVPFGAWGYIGNINNATGTVFLDNISTPSGVPQPLDLFSLPFTAELQTPHVEFTVTDLMTQSIKRGDKSFDYLELQYIPTGAFNLSADIIIDGQYSETKSFYLGKGTQLDSSQLNTMRLQGDSIRTQRLQIHGRGRTISVRLYMSSANRIFKVVGLQVYYRLQGQSEKT